MITETMMDRLAINTGFARDTLGKIVIILRAAGKTDDEIRKTIDEHYRFGIGIEYAVRG